MVNNNTGNKKTTKRYVRAHHVLHNISYPKPITLYHNANSINRFPLEIFPSFCDRLQFVYFRVICTIQCSNSLLFIHEYHFHIRKNVQ